MKAAAHKGLSYEEYDGIKATSRTHVVAALKSPLHYKLARDERIEPTPAMLWGQWFHTLLLEPDQFDCHIRDRKHDGRTRAGKEWKASILAKDLEAGQQLPILTLAQYQELADTVRAVREHEAAVQLLRRRGDAELVLVGELHGVRVKARLDHVSPGIIIDAKTTGDANPEIFVAKTFDHYSYALQAAFYVDLAAEVLGGKHEFFFVTVEKTKPHAVSVVQVHETPWLATGRLHYRRGLDLIRHAEQSKSYPGYPGVYHAGQDSETQEQKVEPL
jgi:hypothetical protein